MTYAAPNPGGFDPFFRQRKEEQIAESRRGAGEPNPGQDPAPPAEPVDELVTPEGPFSLDRLRAHEDERAAARRAEDTAAADEALRQVAGDLGQLLDVVRHQLRETGKGPSRQRVRATAPKVKRALEQALGEAAVCLNVPRERVADVQRLLARDGGVTPADRHQALKDVDGLWARAREAVAARDHVALDELLAVVSPLAVLEVSGGAMVRDVAQAGFAALATFAVHNTEVPDIRATLGRLAEEPAHGPWGQLTVAIRCRTARIATLTRDWPDKAGYWDLLADIETGQADLSAAARLAALAPPS